MSRPLPCLPRPKLTFGVRLRRRSDHIKSGADFQTRIRWKPNTVVLWDSESSSLVVGEDGEADSLAFADRTTCHTAIVDFAKGGSRRHGARITPQAERPFL